MEPFENHQTEKSEWLQKGVTINDAYNARCRYHLPPGGVSLVYKYSNRFYLHYSYVGGWN